jgi:hypothetical protein
MSERSTPLAWVFEPVGEFRALTTLSTSAWASRDEWFGNAIAVLGREQTAPDQGPWAVIARVTSRVPRSITPELAKRLLDTLHDCKHLSPHYRDRGLVPVLVDDDQRFVTGLAVELRVGEVERVDFILAAGLNARADPLGSADAMVAAPNDISSGGAEEIRRQTARGKYVASLRDSWPQSRLPAQVAKCTHLVVRHGPQRDEDNTWATWIGALRRSVAWSRLAWLPAVPPLATEWRATGIASICDRTLSGGVRYDFYSARQTSDERDVNDRT